MKLYSRGTFPLTTNIYALDDSDLSTLYSNNEISIVDNEDDTYVDLSGQDCYLVHLFKISVGVNKKITIKWVGKTSLSPTLSPVYFEIYNHSTGLWETVDIRYLGSANVNFTLSYKIEAYIENYKKNNNISVRVLQRNDQYNTVYVKYYLKQENSFFLLLENSSFILTEESYNVNIPITYTLSTDYFNVCLPYFEKYYDVFNYLLLEDGGYLLQENYYKIGLDNKFNKFLNKYDRKNSIYSLKYSLKNTSYNSKYQNNNPPTYSLKYSKKNTIYTDKYTNCCQ